MPLCKLFKNYLNESSYQVECTSVNACCTATEDREHKEKIINQHEMLSLGLTHTVVFTLPDMVSVI